MDILRNGSRPSGKGSADWFTGGVRVDQYLAPMIGARARAATVRIVPTNRKEN